MGKLDNTENDVLIPQDYSPGLSEEDWTKLLSDTMVFDEKSLEVMKRILHCGGQASCALLAQKYGKNSMYYNTISVNLAKRIGKKTWCKMPPEEKDCKLWPILYRGRDARKKEEVGSFIWYLRPELQRALEKIDLTRINLYAELPYNFWKIIY